MATANNVPNVQSSSMIEYKRILSHLIYNNLLTNVSEAKSMKTFALDKHDV